KLALLLDRHAAPLMALKNDVIRQRANRHADALRLIAELLVDAAALRLSCPPDHDAVQAATAALRRSIREREAACVAALLKRYNFRSHDFPAHTLPPEGERWGMDLFHPQALIDVGIHVGKSMAAGAMAGASLDAIPASLHVGFPPFLGEAGGLWQGADKLGKRVLGKLKGYQEISVDDAVLRLLALRQLALLEALEARGHAAQAPIEIAGSPALTPQEQADPDGWRSGKLPDELLEALSQPQWSTLAHNYQASARDGEVVQSLTRKLAAGHPGPMGSSAAPPGGLSF